jgi:hypothetical protein
MEGKGLPPGTVVLIGSLSYLARVGASIYAAEWRNVVFNMQRKWGGIQICPLIHILNSDIPGSLMPEIRKLAHWFSKVYDGTTNGLTIPWEDFIKSLPDLCEGESELDSPELNTYPFPASLDVSSPIIPWKFSSRYTCPTTILSHDRDGAFEMICSLAVSLHRDFLFQANPEVILQREPADSASEAAKENQPLKSIVLIGGSTLGQMLPAFQLGEIQVLDLTRPGWIINQQNVSKVVEELKEWIPKLEGPVGVVMDIFGNSSVKFRHVDGALVLPMKMGGRYHLLGDAVIESDDGFRNLIRLAAPIFDAISVLPTVVTPPIPRFIFGSCCTDEAHAPNTRDQDYRQDMLNGFAHARGVIKAELVGASSLRHFWVIESLALIGEIPTSMEGKLAALRSSLGSDEVHLTDVGFNFLFRKMSQGMSKVLDRMQEAKKLKSEQIMASVKVSGETYYWRGFSSARGSVRRRPPQGSSARGGSRGRERVRGGRGG